MKKILMIFIMVCFTVAGSIIVEASNITILHNNYYNVTQLNLSVEPIIVEGRTLIPLRSVSEELNMGVDYHVDSETNVRYIRIWNDETCITFSPDNDVLIKNTYSNYYPESNGYSFDLSPDYNKFLKLIYPVKIINGVTFVPIRLLSDSFKFQNLSWDGSTSTIEFDYTAYETPYDFSFKPDVMPEPKYKFDGPIERLNVGDHVQLGHIIQGYVIAVLDNGMATVAWDKYVSTTPSQIFLEEAADRGLYINTVKTVEEYLLFKMQY